MPKVSIIVPVYNAEKYIKKCLDSILNQTYKDIEVIIVNDGSTDNSEEVIKQYLEKEEYNIRYFKNKNKGVSFSRNFGVNYAAGDYIFFVDADDYLDEKLLENLKEEMQKGIDIIKFKAKKVDSKGRILEEIYVPTFNEMSGEEAFEELKYNDVLLDTIWSYVFRKEFYIQNNFKFTENTHHEDFALIPLIIVKAKNVVSIDYYGYYYVQTENSITRNNSYEKLVKRTNDMITHYDNMLEFIKNNNISESSKKSIKDFFANSVILRTEELKGKEQEEYIKKIKSRKLIKNIQVKNVKQLIKKILLYINIKLYLKMR